MNNKHIFVIMIFCFAVVNGCKSLGADLKEIYPCEGVLVLQGRCWSETMTIMDTGKTLVVVDTFGSYPLAEKALTHMNNIFNKPVSHVINTHHHWDHTFGNQVFKNAAIIGHKFCFEDMKKEYSDPANRLKVFKEVRDLMEKDEQPGSDFLQQISAGFVLTLPTLLVDDEYTLKVGDLTFKLYHVPGLHTRSNLTIYVPELGLVFTRINFYQKYLPTLESGVDKDWPGTKSLNRTQRRRERGEERRNRILTVSASPRLRVSAWKDWPVTKSIKTSIKNFRSGWKNPCKNKRILI